MQVLGEPRDELVTVAGTDPAVLFNLDDVAPYEPVRLDHRDVHRARDAPARCLNDIDDPSKECLLLGFCRAQHGARGDLLGLLPRTHSDSAFYANARARTSRDEAARQPDARGTPNGAPPVVNPAMYSKSSSQSSP